MGEGTRRWGGRRQAQRRADKRACAPGPHVRTAGRRGGGKLGSCSLEPGGQARGPAERWSCLRLRGLRTHPCTATWTASSGALRTSSAASWAAARSSATGIVQPPAAWPCPLGHRAPLGAPPGALRARARQIPLPCADDGRSSPEVRAPHAAADFRDRRGGWLPPAQLPPTRRVGVKGWAGSGRLGAPLTLLAGRFGSASRPQLLECPPIVSHPRWWEKGQKNWDAVGVDGAQGHRAAVSRPGAPDEVHGNRQDSVGPMVPAWRRGHFPDTGVDWPCKGHIWASGVGQTPRGPEEHRCAEWAAEWQLRYFGCQGGSSPRGHLMP